jgi:hypothetical protein
MRSRLSGRWSPAVRRALAAFHHAGAVYFHPCCWGCRRRLIADGAHHLPSILYAGAEDFVHLLRHGAKQLVDVRTVRARTTRSSAKVPPETLSRASSMWRCRAHRLWLARPDSPNTYQRNKSFRLCGLHAHSSSRSSKLIALARRAPTRSCVRRQIATLPPARHHRRPRRPRHRGAASAVSPCRAASSSWAKVEGRR